MTTPLTQGWASDPELAPLIPHMGVVNDYRQALQRLQDAWEHLTLLGQMSGIAADMTATAGEFDSLTRSLLDSLAHRLMSNARHSLAAKAQMAIDILVRNLYERTADVAFLATDSAVRTFLEGTTDGAGEAGRAQLEKRFGAYVAKYSVYDDIIVLSPDGDVRARLERDGAVDRSSRTLAEATVRCSAPFLESFGEHDLLAGRRGLLYSAPIRGDSGNLLGVLCLSFRLDDELHRVLTPLGSEGEPGVVTLVDRNGSVLGTSDTWQVPVGARLRLRADGERLCFAGREHLAVAAPAHPYQGYAGPAWRALALMPLSHAFGSQPGSSAPRGGKAAASSLPPGALEQCELFGDELREIPRQALAIQKGLERSVWNGQIHDRKRAHLEKGSRFTGVLLQHVTSTGERIRQVFERAIVQLLRSAAVSVLDEARFSAALGIDILDRNLYERANDCRWWAMDSRLQCALAQPDGGHGGQQILRHIHSLYTVYSRLLLLNANGVVVASSTGPPQSTSDVERVEAAWLSRTLALRDAASYVCSGFERSPLYGGRHSLIYSAAVYGIDRHQALGAVAVVFDAEPQLNAMLRDSLPRAIDGHPLKNAVGMFLQRDGHIVASTDMRWEIGKQCSFHPELAQLERGESRELVLDIDGELFVGGAAMSNGYREYNSSDLHHPDDLICLIMISLCRTSDIPPSVEASRPPAIAAPEGDDDAAACELASFRCGAQWLGLPVGEIMEAVYAPDLTVLPRSREAIVGMMTYRNNPLPVMDLRVMRALAVVDDSASIRRPVLVCEAAGRRFGLMVDELGAVCDVASSAMRPLPGYLAQHDPFAEALIHARDGRETLILLGAQRILAQYDQDAAGDAGGAGT